MRVQKLILIGLFCMHAVLGAKPLSSIVLQNPDQCIDEDDWNMLERDLGYQLSNVKYAYPKSSKLNLKVMVHGSSSPTNPETIKRIELDKHFAYFNEPSQGTLFYTVTGQHLGLINIMNGANEFLCNINVDLPIGIEKKLIYKLNGEGDFLTSKFAQSFNLMRLAITHIASDIYEICYVGYWADYFSEEIQGFDELKQHQGFIELTLQSIKEQLLNEEPTLKDNEELLEKKAKEVFEVLMNNEKQKFTT